MRTYYDPEDDTCSKTDRHERLMELADHLRDEAKDREMEESYNNFPAPRHEYSQTARALLTRCYNKMSGREINACQIATGDYDTTEVFRAHLIDSLAIQFSKEISEHINQQNQ